MRRLPIREPWIVLVPLAVAQWGAVGAFAAVVRHNGWLFYQGGDETFYYTGSWVLAGGHLPRAQIGWGWSYLTSPLGLFAGPSYLKALPVLVVLQAAILLPVALYCVYAITARIAGTRIGYVSAALWVAVPFAAIPLWDQSYHQKFVEQFLPQAFGLTGLGDFPSMVGVLVAALFTLRALDSADLSDAAVAGLAAGFAVGMKPANALFLAGPALGFAAARRWREPLVFIAALTPGLLALALWKYRGLGHLPVLTPNPRAVGAVASSALGSVVIDRYLHVDWSQLGKNYRDLRQLFAGLPAWQSLPIIGLAASAYRRSSLPKVLVPVGWLAAFVVVKGASDQASIDGGTLLRLFMPGLPPLVILSALVFGLVPALRSPEPRIAGPLHRVPLALAAVIFGLVPILLFASLRPLRSTRVLNYYDEHVLVPVDRGFKAQVRRRGTAALVSWNRPAGAAGRSFYRVLRARPVAPRPDPALPPDRQGIRCIGRRPTGYAGSADCWLQMSLVAVTRGTSIRDRPPPGPWVYRIGLAANWRDDPAGGDTFLVSLPASTSR